MHVISYKPIRDAKRLYPDAGTALDHWFEIMTRQAFNNLVDLKQVFPSVDLVGRGHVFNIKGNHYRLAVSIHFNTQRVFIREIMTHAEYSKEHWKLRHQDFH